MAIADKLVLQRQRHLKWRALDRLELALMLLCGILCFGFSLSVTADIVTRTIGHPWLWLQEVTSTLFIYAIFIGAAVATRRNDHLYLTAISELMHGASRIIVEIIIRLVVLGVALCLIWYGYLNYLRGFGSFRLPSGTPIASLYAIIPVSGILIALFTVEQLVNGLVNGFDHPEPPLKMTTRSRRSRPSSRRERSLSPPVILALMSICFLSFGYLGVPVPFSLLAGVFVGALLAGCLARRDHPEDLRRRRFRGAARDPVLPSGRRAHELGECGGAHRQPFGVAGRAYQGRAVAGGRRVLDVLLGNVGVDHGRRCRDEPCAGRADEARGLRARLHRRDHRGRLDHRRAGAAEHHGGGLWRGRQCLDRGPVHGRRRARAS